MSIKSLLSKFFTSSGNTVKQSIPQDEANLEMERRTSALNSQSARTKSNSGAAPKKSLFKFKITTSSTMRAYETAKKNLGEKRATAQDGRFDQDYKGSIKQAVAKAIESRLGKFLFKALAKEGLLKKDLGRTDSNRVRASVLHSFKKDIQSKKCLSSDEKAYLIGKVRMEINRILEDMDFSDYFSDQEPQ